MKQRFIYIIVSFWFLISCTSPKQTEVTSPDGHIRLALTLVIMVGELTGKYWRYLVYQPSMLGFTAKDGVNLAEGFKVINTDFTTHDETWTQPWGENKNIRNHYNEMAVHLSDTTNTKLTLRFRIFDDGLGFRYEYEVPGADSILVTDELTAFNIAQDGTSWSIPAIMILMSCYIVHSLSAG